VKTRVLTTAKLATLPALYGTNRRPTIPQTTEVAFDEQPVPIDPYLLGVLIGDGTMRHTSVKLSAYAAYVRERVRETLPTGVTMKMERRDRPDVQDYRLTVDVGKHFNPLIRALKSVGLWGKYSHEKFIPSLYKYNSRQVRLALLQGIMDTDGSVDHRGQPRLEQTSERLAHDVAEVVQSLGGLATLRTKENSYVNNGVRIPARRVYRQAILYPDAADLFTFPPKKAKARLRARPVRRYIQRVERVGRALAQCISISDERGLYLTDNLIATHNTVGIAILAVERFLGVGWLNGEQVEVEPQRVLYAAPTIEQLETFWFEVKNALRPLTDAGILKKNENEHYIEREGTKYRLKAKTAFNADTLRGDYAQLLIFDEWQLCNEDAWNEVGAPMLADYDGDAVFIYTPPSLRSSGISKAHDPLHASKMWKRAAADETGRWSAFHFRSADNPHISAVALEELTQDMSWDAYRREIEAEDEADNPDQLIYKEFNTMTQVIPPVPIGADWNHFVGHDFGGANPAALFITQNPHTGYYYVYEEYRPISSVSIPNQVEEFIEITKGRTVLKRMGGSHQEMGERAAYGAHGWHISEPKKKMQRVMARIDAVKSMMEKNQIFVFDNCRRLRQELSTYLWKLDTEGIITDDIRNKNAFHLMDCLAYIMSDFIPETSERGKIHRYPSFAGSRR
jgi:hypothetical protein